MASTTQCWSSPRDGHHGGGALRGALLVSLLLGLVGACTRNTGDFGFSIIRVDTRWAQGALHVAVQQKLILSDEAKEALVHGVPLVFQTQVRVDSREPEEELLNDSRIFEIRYLPLSERYQLSTSPPLQVRTFPRLRHALADLATVEFTFNGLALPVPEMELQVRSQLDKHLMPPPMRLPVWFSSQWDHDSGWTVWPIGNQP